MKIDQHVVVVQPFFHSLGDGQTGPTSHGENLN